MAAAKIEPVAASQAETEKEKARGKSSRGRLRGIVDAFDLDKGIEGWAFDLENPDGRLAVDLVIGDAVVASTTADRPRADMADQSRTAHIGFAFPSTIFDQICNMIDMGHDGSLVVRIADTSHILPPRVPLPDLAAIFDHVRMRQATSSTGRN